jgi:hypothetical protein
VPTSDQRDVFVICPGCGREKPATYELTVCDDCGEELPLIEPGVWRVVRHDEENQVLVLRREAA